MDEVQIYAETKRKNDKKDKAKNLSINKEAVSIFDTASWKCYVVVRIVVIYCLTPVYLCAP